MFWWKINKSRIINNYIYKVSIFLYFLGYAHAHKYQCEEELLNVDLSLIDKSLNDNQINPKSFRIKGSS